MELRVRVHLTSALQLRASISRMSGRADSVRPVTYERLAVCSRRPATRRTSTPRRSAWRAGRWSPPIARYRRRVGGDRPGLRPRRGGRRARARTSVAALIGADPSDVALIASVSAAAGLVAAQFGPAAPGQNVVIGEREYSSNHYPWRLLAEQGLRGSAGPVPKRRAGTRRRRAARRRRDRAGRVQRRADRDRAPFRHPGDQRDRASGRRDRVRRRLATRRRVAGRRRSRRRRRVGDRRSQVPAARGSRSRLLLSLPRDAGAVRAGQRGLEGRTRPVRELLRAGDGPLADRVAFRQLDQLARGDRKRGRALRVRRLRRRRHLRPEPRAGRTAPGIARRGRLDARSTCPRPIAARIVSVPLGDAEPAQPPGGAEARAASCARPATATCASRSTSTTTRTTSIGSRGRFPSCAAARRTQGFIGVHQIGILRFE